VDREALASGGRITRQLVMRALRRGAVETG
jgi:hypothetical protein